MIGVYNRSVILTYIGVMLSLAGMSCLGLNQMGPAMICLIFAGICDLFDGVIARRCKRTEEEKQFGIMIDSLADVVSFLVFPSLILLVISSFSGWGYVTAVLYTLAGIIRLAWFHVHTAGEERVSYYEGLPVTYIALILPSVYLLTTLVHTEVVFIWNIVYLVVAFLFLLKVRIAKPTGLWYAFFSVLAVAETVAILVLRI